MNGLLLVDKPVGITSFDVIRKLRMILKDHGKVKLGHAGTLDPLASGLMLILCGTACKEAMSLTKLDKTYLAELTLGANSATGDAEGEKLPISDATPNLEALREALEAFVGQITQTPSVYSAIKIAGQEAYKRARRGETIEMPSREVSIRTINLLNYSYPHVELETDVSSGTYIRSLAEDIGAKLGTGAYLSSLRRTRVGDFSLDRALGLDDATAEGVEKALISLT